MSFICGLLWLLSALSFTIAKKFKNGFEITVDMKGRDFMVFIYCVIGVLGMVPTGGSGCCSRMLTGERSVGYVKYKRRPREVRVLRRPPRCRSQRHLSFLGVSSSFDCSRLTNATLGETALHCIKSCSICQIGNHR